MALDWTNQQEVLKRRQMAIQAGYKPADVDSFIKTQKSNAATMQLGIQGQLPESVYTKIVQDNPILGEKLFKAGAKPQTKSTATQQKNSDAYNSTLNFIQNLEQNYQDAGGGSFGNGPTARIQGIIKSLAGKAGLDDSASAYEREKQGFAATLKSLTGDTGVLTDQDYARLSKLLPDLGSTPGESKKLLNDLRSQLSAKFGGKKTTTPLDFKSQPQNSQSGNLQVLGASTGPQQQVPTQSQGIGLTAQGVQTGIGDLVANLLLPRTKAALEQGPQAMMQKQAQRPNAKGDIIQSILNSLGQTGDLAKVAIPAGVEAGGVLAAPSAFSASSVPAAMEATGALGALHGATTPNASIADRARNAAGEGVLAMLTTGALREIPKVIHPFKTAGEFRAAKIAEAQGKTIDGDKLVKGLQKVRSQVPSTELQSFDNMVSQAKSAYAGKEISVEDAVQLNSRLNDAFLASGKIGKSAKALVEKNLGDTVRTELRLTAPDVTAANKLFQRLYGARKLAPLALRAGAGGLGAGLGGAAAYKILGK